MRTTWLAVVTLSILTTLAGSASGSIGDTDDDGLADSADNCRFIGNSGQEDDGGLGDASPQDLIGNGCQCGNVSGSGHVDAADVAAYRQLLANPSGAPLSAAAITRCVVFGDQFAPCAVLQVAVIRRALAVPALGPLTDATSAQHCSAALTAENLHVATTGTLGGAGTAASPYRRITDAVARARADRLSGAVPPDGWIQIHVAGGTYYGSFSLTTLQNYPNTEVLPIILNVPKLAVLGSTVLIRDAVGLATGSQTLGRTTLRSDTNLLAQQALLLITPTSDVATVNEVTVDGFVLDGVGGSFLSRAVTVYRVSDFTISNNVVQRAGFGIFTKLASGTIEGNLLSNNGDSGSLVFGGSLNHPARLLVRANRIEGNGEHGLQLIAVAPAGSANLGTNPLEVEPLQTTFDRDNPADLPNIPDTLDATVTGNLIASNTDFGIRLAGVVPTFPSTTCPSSMGYDTANSTQSVTANLTVNIEGNALSLNGYHGVGMEAAYPCRSDPRRLILSYVATFAGNSFSANGRAGGLFTFTRWRPSLGLDTLEKWKFAEDSIYQVTDLDGELTPFDYDNPLLDPFDGVTHLDNTLTLNGVAVPPGTSITP